MFGNKNKNGEDVELGFGTKNYQGNVRFLNKNGTVNIKRKGLRSFDNIDTYHWLITTSWTNLIVIIFLSYILVNTLFACVYFALGYEHFGGIEGFSGPDRFMDLFFFSAQTLTTVGYGHVYPNRCV